MKFKILFLAILFWGTTNNMFSQVNCSQDKGCITGVVVDKKTNQPLDFATVRVFDENGRVVAATYTNEKGFYSIYDLKPGVYKVTASYVGFEMGIKENIDIQPNVTTHINFSLKEETGLIEIIIVK